VIDFRKEKAIPLAAAAKPLPSDREALQGNELGGDGPPSDEQTGLDAATCGSSSGVDSHELCSLENRLLRHLRPPVPGVVVIGDRRTSAGPPGALASFATVHLS
jgi:hypothetical protein